jgi:hypothetical protein
MMAQMEVRDHLEDLGTDGRKTLIIDFNEIPHDLVWVQKVKNINEDLAHKSELY